MQPLEILQRIIDEGGKLIFAKFEDCVQVKSKIRINEKDYVDSVNVCTVKDFIQEKPLNAMLTSISRHKRGLN